MQILACLFVTKIDTTELIGTQHQDRIIEKMMEDMEEKEEDYEAVKGELREIEPSTKQLSDVLVS